MIGEPSIYEGAGIKPDSSDIVGRCGKDQRIVAVCWKAEGGDPGDARKAAWGSFDPYIEEARAKAEPPGAGKKVSTSTSSTATPARGSPDTRLSPGSRAPTV